MLTGTVKKYRVSGFLLGFLDMFNNIKYIFFACSQTLLKKPHKKQDTL